MQRKVTAVALIILLLLSLFPVSILANDIIVEGSDQTITFTIGQMGYQAGQDKVTTDVAPYIKTVGNGGGHTMVPVAFVAPALGTEQAIWLPSERAVQIKKGSTEIRIVIDSKELLVNGKAMQMDVAAEIVEVGNGGGRTMLPIAFIARALEVGYQWNGATNSVDFYGYTKTYEQKGTFGPDAGIDTIEGNVIVKADGVVLQNTLIKGNLTIAEEVGDGDVTLNNITVQGETFVRGGGKDSIHIKGGSFPNVTIDNVNGQVRIVARDVNGLQVVISGINAGEEVILDGNFAQVNVNSPAATIRTFGDTTIGEINICTEGAGSTINLGTGTIVEKMVLESQAEVKGEGTIKQADVKADDVSFQKAPEEMTVDPSVQTPPDTTSTGGTTDSPGGGYIPEPPPADPPPADVKPQVFEEGYPKITTTDTSVGIQYGPPKVAGRAYRIIKEKNDSTTDLTSEEVKSLSQGYDIFVAGRSSYNPLPKSEKAIRANTEYVVYIIVTDENNTKDLSDVMKIEFRTTENVDITGIGLNQATMNLCVGGEEGRLFATVYPNPQANPNVTWTSSDPDVAQIPWEFSGTVRPLKAGTATITATSVKDPTKSASCLVTISSNASLDFTPILELGYPKVIPTDTSARVEFGRPQVESRAYAVIKGKDDPAPTSAEVKAAKVGGYNIYSILSIEPPYNTYYSVRIMDDLLTSNTEYAAYIVITDENNTVDLTEVIKVEFSTAADIPVVGVTMAQETLELTAGGEPWKLSATVSPNHANPNLIWESSDESVATVDIHGRVTAVALGTATITAKSVKDPTKFASCVVTVKGIIDIGIKAKITITEIAGVTPPLKDAVPVTMIIETEQYTGTVSWDPTVDTTFAEGTAYTATITLTPKAGYTLNGVVENFFTVAGATSVSNVADSGLITAVFPGTEG